MTSNMFSAEPLVISQSDACFIHKAVKRAADVRANPSLVLLFRSRRSHLGTEALQPCDLTDTE
ncbi:hypothetical protein CCH79_00020387 [Gambusia affinis]|uniref:Uncharacterized protein n=1 Tax=Gambusia affinis TaxID=33528 RepID=A0A315WQP6_GAMAF|nr:hypothetical protein CCH79_00020387 [Gambusia affinis]